MTILNSTMPEAARLAFQQAHQARATGKANNKRKPATAHHRLTPEHRQHLADERAYNKQRGDDNRERLASKADLFLYDLKKPRLTARRLQIAQVGAAADKASVAKARDPQRQRAAMQRHINTVNYSILKARGLK